MAVQSLSRGLPVAQIGRTLISRETWWTIGKGRSAQAANAQEQPPKVLAASLLRAVAFVAQPLVKLLLLRGDIPDKYRYIYIYIYVHTHTLHIYIYIHTIYIYYICIHTHTHISDPPLRRGHMQQVLGRPEHSETRRVGRTFCFA